MADRTQAMGKDRVIPKINHGSDALAESDRIGKLPTSDEGIPYGGEQYEIVERRDRRGKITIWFLAKDSLLNIAEAVSHPLEAAFAIHLAKFR